MTHLQSVFSPKTDTIKDKVKRLLWTALIYLPLLGLVCSGSWYINKQMPNWVSHYFNVASAEKIAIATNNRVQIAERAMSFPIGVTSYVSAQINHMTASTKAATLSFASDITTSLMRAIMYVLFILLGIYVIFKFIKTYKTKSAEERIARNVVNMLLPILSEINENIKKQNQQAPKK
ncbi:MAG: hypothetical protein IKV03_04140 [Alphaproteobacteria bacterium]|nr:hypothetical protein [Alphaproteobacteria bacterium]